MRKIRRGEPLEVRGEERTVGTGFSIGIVVLRERKNLLEDFENMRSHSVGCCNGG